jgi:hypothetical protein
LVLKNNGIPRESKKILNSKKIRTYVRAIFEFSKGISAFTLFTEIIKISKNEIIPPFKVLSMKEIIFLAIYLFSENY